MLASRTLGCNSYLQSYWNRLARMKILTLVFDREVRLMVDTQIACLTEDVLPALKKKGLNLVDYAELHLHEKDQVISLHVFMLK